jgi:hypothetical protein
MPSPDLEALKAVTVGENEKHGLRRIKDRIYEGWLEAANSMEADFGSQTFRGTPFSSIPIEHKFILELRDAKAEVERLRGENVNQEIALGQQAVRIANLYAELDNAKRIGAAEELERLFHNSIFITEEDGSHNRAVTLDAINKRAAQLRKEAE